MQRSGSRARVVFLKELRETFRDWRTVFSVVISPLLLTPLLLALVGGVLVGESQKEKAEVVRVAVVAPDGAPIPDWLTRDGGGYRFQRVSEAEAAEGIRSRRFGAGLKLPPDTLRQLSAGKQVSVALLLDPGRDASQRAAGRIQDLLEKQERELVISRVERAGLSREVLEPFKVREQPVPGSGSATALALATFLPYIMTISAILGSVYAANDLVAGEKERGTLEALLVTPASRGDLVLGKFLAVATVSLVSSQLSVVGLLWPFLVPLPGLEWLTGAGLQLGVGSVVLMLLVQVPLAVLGAGLLLAVSTYARNQKEAQSYLGPVMVVATVCAMLSMLIRVEPPLALALVPILNASLALKQALSGSIQPAFTVVAFGTSVVYAILMVRLAAWLFTREAVLLKA